VRSSYLTLSVGCKQTRLALVNLDLDPRVSPDVVADARALPFRSNVFDEVIFTEVIEHIPSGHESLALTEIHRVLRVGGVIMSTPNNILLFKILDPAYYLMRHRHYDMETISMLLTECGFSLKKVIRIWWGIHMLRRTMVPPRYLSRAEVLPPQIILRS
jgi:predicted SAM-dependent methyltransferase